jgi:hypothetical protein
MRVKMTGIIGLGTGACRKKVNETDKNLFVVYIIIILYL